MGLAYKCDRCGEIIPDLESASRKIIHRNFVRGDTIFDGFNTRATINQFNKEITLCKECDDSFIHWFQSGKEAVSDVKEEMKKADPGIALVMEPESDAELQSMTKLLKVLNRCPECGDPLTHEGGCDICKNCGWSKCT